MLAYAHTSTISPTSTAARVTLVLQNLLIIICAILFYFFIVYYEALNAGTWFEFFPFPFKYVAYGLIITMTTVENLASIACTIAVERDWIVEISDRDEERLASEFSWTAPV